MVEEREQCCSLMPDGMGMQRPPPPIDVKAYKRLWILRRLKTLGASREDLLDVFVKQVRSVMELAVPAWHSGLTIEEASDIKRVQRAALHIILGEEYNTYKEALKLVNLGSLESRRVNLCKKFSSKAAKNQKHSNWFILNQKTSNTRQEQPVYCLCKTRRFKTSPLSYLTSLLKKYSKK